MPNTDQSPQTMAPHAEVADRLHTALDYLRYAVSCFERAGLHFGHGTDNAVDEARLLVCHALHLPLDAPDALFHGRLLEEEKARVLALITRRIEERCPAPYLTGEAWFAGLPFTVDERVIVPRSPIAELIETGFAPWVESPEQVERVLDLCTGSGCIAIACAHAFPNAEVDAVDISAPALEVAAANVERYDLADRVHPIASDLFAEIGGQVRYSLIVCNPPYVGHEELVSLPAEFDREPTLALAGGDDGLALIGRILDGAAQHLTADGLLVLELGNTAPAAEERWPSLPFTWLEFERGGHGVCLLHAGDLRQRASWQGSEDVR